MHTPHPRTPQHNTALQHNISHCTTPHPPPHLTALQDITAMCTVKWVTCELVQYVSTHDVVEAHCYFVGTGQTDREQIRSRINNNDCRTFRPWRPLSTVYKTVMYAVENGLRGRNVLQSLLLILLRICSRSVHPACTHVRMPWMYCIFTARAHSED